MKQADNNNAVNQQATEQIGRGAKAANEISDFVAMILKAICAVIVIFTFVGRIVTVDGSSMTYTLEDQDRLLVSSLGYEPQNGDIIILRTDAYGSNALVKRVIATEGDVVDIDPETWTVTVNGEKLDEPYVRFREGEAMHIGPDMYPLEVGEGKMFVMGDNRNGSSDSRVFGVVDVRDCLGKVYMRIFPLNKFGIVR